MTDNQITFEEIGDGFYYVDYCEKFTGCMIYTILIVGIIWFTTLYYQCDQKDGILVPGVFTFHCIEKDGLK